MSIKSQGGVFGRNPTFNDVTVEGDLSIDGTLSVGGNVLSGLDFEGAWDATSGAPSATPSTGQFWIVSVAGTTNLSGITNWGIGDWALYDGSAWQRIEGGANGNFKELTSSSTTVLNGTTIPASKTLVVTTDIGSTVEAYDATILKSADIGSTVQGYDADTAKYDDTTANFTGTLQNGGSNVVVDTDIGNTVQAYDADTAKLDVAQTWTAKQTFGATDIDGAVVINESGADVDFRIESDANTHAFFLEGSSGRVGIGTSSPSSYNVAANNLVVGSSTGSNGLTIVSATTSDGSIHFADGTGVNAYRGHIYYSHATNYMVFSTDATERMRIDSSGDVTVSTGNLIIGTSGKGIDFSATAGTGTSELFDDYEEGAWTPTQGSFSTWSSPTFTATYTKIGRVVHLNLRQTGGTVGWSAGQAMAGIPYVAGGSVGSIGYASDSGPTSDNGPIMVWSNGNIYFQKAGSESNLVFTVTYYV